MTSAFDTAFQRRFRERLQRELTDREATILAGTLSKFEDYKRLVGIREGLMRAAEIAVETEKELTSPPERKPAA